jgi:hypothetical protein
LSRSTRPPQRRAVQTLKNCRFIDEDKSDYRFAVRGKCCRGEKIFSRDWKIQSRWQIELM